MSTRDLLRSAARFPGRLWRLSAWALGKRSYPWWASPPHRLLSVLAQNAYGRPTVRHRAQYAVAAGLLKYRQRVYADHMNFGMRLEGPVTADVLRNLVLWQRAVLRTPPLAPKPHANLHVSGDAEQVQLDRLVSLLLLSDVFENVNVFFDERAAHDARPIALTIAEQHRPGSESDLNAAQPVRAAMFGDPCWARIFSMNTGFVRLVNGYLKTAHPGAFIVALSLMESDDGLCDASLGRWKEAVSALAPEIPHATFVVLNRVGPATLHSAEASVRRPIAFARRAGLTLGEAVCLAQKADAFVGFMDMFGLAARAAGRPGVYMSRDEESSYDPEAGIACTGIMSPQEALERLRTTLATRRRSLRALPANGHSLPPPFATVRETPALEPGRQAGPATVPLPPAAPAAGSSPETGKRPVRETRNATRSSDPLTSRYTLVIPTYNRHDLLSRLLAYLEREAAFFPIAVLDSSAEEIQEKNARAISEGRENVRHVRYPTTINPYVKMREGFGTVTTPCCSMCADDDLIVIPALRRCLEELERDPEAAVAHGYYFNFTENSTFDLSYIVQRGNSVEGEMPFDRLRAHFERYDVLLYGVYRTSVAQRVFRDVHRMDTVLGQELLSVALTAIAGKVLRAPIFFCGRCTGESVSYAAWHPHQILAKAPAILFDQYPLFRELLLEGIAERSPGLDLRGSAVAVDLIMLRYLAPFLRHDVLDLIIDDRLRAKGSDATVDRIWDVFVRTPNRTVHPVEPLIDPDSGGFTPETMASAGPPRDYVFESNTADGSKRTYRVLYEFLFPDMRPPAVVGRDELMPLLGALDSY